MKKENLVTAWLATTTALLVVVELAWPSRAIAAVGLVGAVLLFLSIREKSQTQKTQERPPVVPPEEPHLKEVHPKRDLEDF